MSETHVYTIRLEYATYTFREHVTAEDEEQAIAKAWTRLRRRGGLTLPMAYTAAHVEAVSP